MNMKQETIKVHDLGVAAALITSGFTVQKIVYSENHRANFVFNKSPWLEPSIEHYWSVGLNVDARKLVENIKTLKSRIYADK